MPSLPAFADAVEGSECAADTHLALLGVKRQETAFWVKKAALTGCFFIVLNFMPEKGAGFLPAPLKVLIIILMHLQASELLPMPHPEVYHILPSSLQIP